jgi:hypothetical protein
MLGIPTNYLLPNSIELCCLACTLPAYQNVHSFSLRVIMLENALEYTFPLQEQNQNLTAILASSQCCIFIGIKACPLHPTNPETSPPWQNSTLRQPGFCPLLSLSHFDIASLVSSDISIQARSLAWRCLRKSHRCISPYRTRRLKVQMPAHDSILPAPPR